MRHILHLSLVSVAILSCKQGDQSAKKDEAPQETQVADNDPNKQQPDGGAEDLSVEVLVPMGLIDPAYLAKMIAAVPKSLGHDVNADASTQDPDKTPARLVGRSYYDGIDDDTDHFYYERIGMTAPNYQVTAVLRELQHVQTLLTQCFGVGGFFGTTDLRLAAPGGVGSRTFKLPEVAGSEIFTKPKYAVVSYDQAKPLPFAIDFFQTVGTALNRTTRLEFARQSPESKDISVYVQHSRVTDDWADYVYYTETRWKTWESSVELVEGWKITQNFDAFGNQNFQEKYVTQLSFTDTEVSVNGGVRWTSSTRDAWPSDPTLVRLQHAVKGDIDVFSAIASRIGNEEAVQRLAYLPVEARPTYGFGTTAKLWAEQSYYQHSLQRLLQLVRTPELNPTCATTGDLLRGGYTALAETPPQTIVDLPADLCLANTAVTSAQLETALKDMCLRANRPMVDLGARADAMPVLDEKLDGSGYDVCEKVFHVAVVANPQYLEMKDGLLNLILYNASPAELRTPAAPTPAHAALLPKLDAMTPFSFQLLADSPATFDVPTKAETDFAKAEGLEALVLPPPKL